MFDSRREYQEYLESVKGSVETDEIEVSSIEELPPVRKPLVCACMCGGPRSE
jgi:hypothetical protein